ncbi:MAG: hypothetical protein RIE03_01345, partial [Pseudomonadales bacterium]
NRGLGRGRVPGNTCWPVQAPQYSAAAKTLTPAGQQVLPGARSAGHDPDLDPKLRDPPAMTLISIRNSAIRRP